MALFFLLQLLATDNGRFRITGASHEESTDIGGRHSPVHQVSGSEPRHLITHGFSGRSRPLGSAVVVYHAGSVSITV